MIKWLFIVLMFVLGLYVNLNYGSHQMKEGFTPRCQDVLVQEGEELILKNTKLAEIPGVNPVRFKNLEDYAEFVEWQQSQNIYCPVLFYKKTFDAQNNAVYQEGPSPVDVIDKPPYPTNLMKEPPNPLLNNYVAKGGNYNYGATDATGVGDNYGATDVKGVSDNAMDFNWGGVDHEQKSVDEGKYKGSEVIKHVTI